MFIRNILESNPDLPPPTTATVFPLNIGASHVAHSETPFSKNSFSPLTPSFLNPLPEQTTRLLVSYWPLSVFTRNLLPFLSTDFTSCSDLIETLKSSRCS